MATTEAPAPIFDPQNPNILRWPDIGLTLSMLDFINETEEAAMIDAFHARDPLSDSMLAKRRRISQHFGHHFDYTTFGASDTHLTPLPPYITSFLPRLPTFQDCLPPEQFTIQYYPPGSGIPPHVDTHSLFAEPLYSLSFGGAVPMQFRPVGPNDARKMRLPKRSIQSQAPGQDTQEEGSVAPAEPSSTVPSEWAEAAAPCWELVLPPRSLLLMTGSSRYGYTHAIRPRKTDVIDGRTMPRQGRYSITMRKVRRGEEIGCDCAYPGVRDARIREEMEAARSSSAGR
ncbi:hypothetical protein C8A01DRAFT_49340 [Parachaetomium inaequale]|uniref:Fe2OG dioxygenase domain-containing protein n=1 Tax=Parachaetomium inaequale TaxID=2588326 RepID=A0AAN6SMV6_9PEZI|nr:hypothetical protein C8A01DRAFT_49340 [Parachaetomium inaequale]